MFERIANGWELAKQSATVLRLDKELLLFPLLSGISCILVMATFAVPLWFSGGAELAAGGDPQVVLGEEDIANNPLAWVVLFLFYWANYTVIVFFNSALITCAIIRFRGEDPTIGDGLRAATARLPQILAWAAVSATVGVILRVIESRSEKVGEFVAGLLGLGWSIATYFVVPILVVEKAGPVQGFKRSTEIVRKTWGEALSANFGVGFIIFLAMLPGIALLILAGVSLANQMASLAIALLACGVVWLIVMSLVSAALDSVILAALYLYAADGEVPRYFDGGLLGNAFGAQHD